MRPLENGCCPYREVQFASIAAVEAALACRDAILTRASRAGNPIRPEAGLKVKPCCLLVGEHCEKLKGRNCALAHELIVDNSLEVVKYYFELLILIFRHFALLVYNQQKETEVPFTWKTLSRLAASKLSLTAASALAIIS